MPADHPEPAAVLPYARPPEPGAPNPNVPLPPEAVAEPPVRLAKALLQMGPGLILAGSIVGTGELIATTHLGAKVGFALLWLVVVSCFIKVFVQVELGRYAISEGRTTMAALSDVPHVGRFFGAWWVVMTLATQLQLGAMVGGVAQALHMAMPSVAPSLRLSPEVLWGGLVAVTTSAVLAGGSYWVIEKVSTLLVVTFTAGTVLCVVLLPAAGHPIHWGEVRQGLTFTVPAGAVAAAIAMFGITGVGASELVAYPYWCLEKGYARKAGLRDASPEWAARARGWMSVLRLDAWFSMGIYTIATLAFYFLGAAVLHDRRGEGLPSTVGGMLDTLRGMYTPVLGQQGSTIFIVAGAIAVLYSTLFGSTAGNSRGMTDFLAVNRLARIPDARSRERWVRGMCVVFPLVDFALFLMIGNPVLMVLMGGFAQAVTLPMLAGSAVYLRYRRTDPRLRPGMWWDLFLWLSLAGLIGVAVIGVASNVQKAMGK